MKQPLYVREFTRFEHFWALMSQFWPNCPTGVNKNMKVNNKSYLSSLLELCNDTLLLLEARSISPAKREETGLFEPQRMMGIFGALVSNDRAAEWVEGE